MPGKGYLNKQRKSTRALADADRKRTINEGLRQEWREGVSNTAPMHEGNAIAAAARARMPAGPTGQQAGTPPTQANAYGPPVAPGQGPG